MLPQPKQMRSLRIIKRIGNAIPQTINITMSKISVVARNIKREHMIVKYADKRNSVCAIIQGSNERARGEIIIKDLIAGAQVGSAAKDMPREDYLALKERAQVAVREDGLVAAVKDVLARHG